MFEQATALLFDLDGTIINTDDVYVTRLTEVFDPVFGRVKSPVLARKLWMFAETPGNLAIEILDTLHLDTVLRPLHRQVEKVSGRHRSAEQHDLVPQAVETIAKLAETYKIGLITTRDRGTIDAFLAHFPEIAQYIQVSIGASDTLRMKPHPTPVRLAAEKLGVRPEQCIMIGDTTVDIRSGRSAGAKTIGVLSGFGERHELIACGADLILPSIAQIPSAIEASQHIITLKS